MSSALQDNALTLHILKQRYYWKRVFLQRELPIHLLITGAGIAFLLSGFTLGGWLLTATVFAYIVNFSWHKLTFSKNTGAVIALIVALMWGVLSANRFVGDIHLMILFGLGSLITNTVLYIVDIPELIEKGLAKIRSLMGQPIPGIELLPHTEAQKKNSFFVVFNAFCFLLALGTAYVLTEGLYHSLASIAHDIGTLHIIGLAFSPATPAFMYTIAAFTFIANLAFVYMALVRFQEIFSNFWQAARYAVVTRTIDGVPTEIFYNTRLAAVLNYLFNIEIKDGKKPGNPKENKIAKIGLTLLFKGAFVVVVALFSQVPLIVRFSEFVPHVPVLFQLLVAFAITSRLITVGQKALVLGQRFMENLFRGNVRNYFLNGIKQFFVNVKWAGGFFAYVRLTFYRRVKERVELQEMGMLLWRQKYAPLAEQFANDAAFDQWAIPMAKEVDIPQGISIPELRKHAGRDRVMGFLFWQANLGKDFRDRWGHDLFTRWTTLAGDNWLSRFQLHFRQYYPYARWYHYAAIAFRMAVDVVMWPFIIINAVAVGLVAGQGQGPRSLEKSLGLSPAISTHSAIGGNTSASLLFNVDAFRRETNARPLSVSDEKEATPSKRLIPDSWVLSSYGKLHADCPPAAVWMGPVVVMDDVTRSAVSSSSSTGSPPVTPRAQVRASSANRGSASNGRLPAIPGTPRLAGDFLSPRRGRAPAAPAASIPGTPQLPLQRPTRVKGGV